MSATVTFLTPTYMKDLERFTLQRESLERCSIDIPHVAVVNHEDMSAFRDMPFQNKLTLVSTKDVFTPKWEAHRLAWGSRRREIRHWRGRPGVHGWYCQQLLKLAAPDFLDTSAIVCLDSDALFIDTVRDSDFYAPDGRLHMYETSDDVDVEMAHWYACSMGFLNIPTGQMPVKRTTHCPVPMHRQVLLDMRQYVEKAHGMFYMDAMLKHSVMEYSTYGAFARYVDKFQHTTPVVPPLSLYAWWKNEFESLDEARIRDGLTQGKKLLLVNSSHDTATSVYRHLVEGIWPVAANLRGTPTANAEWSASAPVHAIGPNE